MELQTQRPVAAALNQEEIESLLANVAEQDAEATVTRPGGFKARFPKEAIQYCAFQAPARLSPDELRKLRAHHESFIDSLAARLSIYLRLDFGLQLSNLELVPGRKFLNRLADSTHLTLFRIEPLPGLCLLDLSPRLGLTIVDRLMGGPGRAVSVERDLSELEIALLDQAIQIILAEWCAHWAKLKELRPTLLGHENNPRFLQVPAADASLVVLDLEARVGDCLDQIQMAFPGHTLEPLIQLLCQTPMPAGQTPAPQPATKPKWSPGFDSVSIPLTATWPGRQLTARQLTQLKPGDLLEWDPDAVSQVSLRLARSAKFIGRLGTRNNKWAVEITGLSPQPSA